jgi:F420-dependent oxidoreductase-like protein
MPLTRLGLQIPSFTYPGVPDSQLFDRVSAIAVAAEESGFDSVWVMDHFYQIRGVGDRTEPMLEAYSLLNALAARTERANLGTMVTGVTYRNPALLAKIVTTLDVISSGRALLGIGAAWNEDEHRGYGIPFPPVKERMDRLEEALQICRAMFTEEAPSFNGRYYQIDGALNYPRPIHGDIPILIGGSGERRTLRLVAQYADACNVFGDLSTIRHKIDVLEQHCATVGRDPAEITKTNLSTLVIAPSTAEAERLAGAAAQRMGMSAQQFRDFAVVGNPDEVSAKVQQYFDAGLDGVVFNMPNAHDISPVRLAGETLTKAFGI